MIDDATRLRIIKAELIDWLKWITATCELLSVRERAEARITELKEELSNG